MTEVQRLGQSPFDAVSRSDFADLSSKLSGLVSKGSGLRAEQRILASLAFRQIHVRQSTIPESHVETFSWIFRSEQEHGPSMPKVQFLQWLERGEGVYWVGGKAGSGKSCLMKFLCDHSETQNALEVWAGSNELVTASFFFWSSGTDLQKSQEGLLHTLLFEILRKCPHLISRVAPNRWGDSVEREWTHPELLATIGKLSEENQSTIKFCFFIDGLDEYRGDPRDVVDVVKKLTKWSNIKLCVSSRPWPIFKQHYDLDMAQPQRLYLQDLTREDIEKYVRDELESNSMFVRARKGDAKFQDLVTEIVDRAQGVFLWVFLVVRSLLHGLTNADTLDIMQERLHELPVELDDFFQHMLDSIDDVYRTQMLRSFQVAIEAEDPLPLLLFSFVDDLEHDPELALDSGTQTDVESSPFPSIGGQTLSMHSLISEKEEGMQRRLDARSKGLLEVCREPSAQMDAYLVNRVDFLHRTVREFLHKTFKVEGFASGIPHFDPTEAICHAMLAMIKRLPLNCARQADAGLLDELIDDFLHYSFRIECKENGRLKIIIENLENFLSLKFSDGHERTMLDRRLLRDTAARSLFELCVQRGLSSYVDLRLDQRPAMLKGPWHRPLLVHALFPAQKKYPLKDLTSMIGVLIKHGAPPNEKFGKSSVWGTFVASINAPDSSDSVTPIEARSLIRSKLPLIELLLDGGADPNTHQFFSKVATGWGSLSGWARIRLEEKCLARGANPNIAYGSSTVWKTFLSDIYDHKERIKLYKSVQSTAEHHDRFQEAKLFLSHGADPDIWIRKEGVRRTRVKTKIIEYPNDQRADEAIKAIFDPAEADELLRLWKKNRMRQSRLRRFQAAIGPWR